MKLEQLQPLQPPRDGIVSRRREPAVGVDPASLFGGIFQAALDQVRESDAQKARADYLLSTGQLENPAELSIASSKAELSLQLLAQLRNKALDAYGELMRINL